MYTLPCVRTDHLQCWFFHHHPFSQSQHLDDIAYNQQQQTGAIFWSLAPVRGGEEDISPSPYSNEDCPPPSIYTYQARAKRGLFTN